MSVDDVKWFALEVAPYASVFALLAGLLWRCFCRCEKWRDDD